MTAIRNIGDAELHCRDYGHHWDDYRKHGKRVSIFEDARTSICDSCSSLRHSAYNLAGKAEWHYYELTEAYHEACQFTRAEARLERERREKRGNLRVAV